MKDHTNYNKQINSGLVNYRWRVDARLIEKFQKKKTTKNYVIVGVIIHAKEKLLVEYLIRNRREKEKLHTRDSSILQEFCHQMSPFPSSVPPPCTSRFFTLSNLIQCVRISSVGQSDRSFEASSVPLI